MYINGMVMDLNADVGEGCGHDAALMPLITSASIACGGHTGDAVTMRRTVALAIQHGVSIGAHVSYPDREHFGRRDMTMSSQALMASVLQQLHALGDIARAVGARVRYVKAHGTLYNRMADDISLADAVINAIKVFDASLALLTLPGSLAMQRVQTQSITAVGEAFADRAYTADGRLVPRTQAGAVITNATAVAHRAVVLATTGNIMSVEGEIISLQARSLCLHGDTPGAVALARAVRKSLDHAGVSVCAFA